MSLPVLRRMLRERLAAGCDAAGIPPARRNWEGAGFATPDPIALHVRESLVPDGAESIVATAGQPIAELRGTYRVDVYAPVDRGTAEIDAAVEAIRAAYAPGGQVVAEGLWLWLESATPARLVEDDRVLHCPLNITWRARRVVPRS